MGYNWNKVFVVLSFKSKYDTFILFVSMNCVNKTQWGEVMVDDSGQIIDGYDDEGLEER